MAAWRAVLRVFQLSVVPGASALPARDDRHGCSLVAGGVRLTHTDNVTSLASTYLLQLEPTWYRMVPSRWTTCGVVHVIELQFTLQTENERNEDNTQYPV